MSLGPSEGLLDLEKELTCPICTDVLYQPLTVLDCLHTCCGSCLREWFAWQASRATTSSPYTCPSCRASVRGTRPNATVTTLVEHLLRAHPGKAKTQADRDEIAKTYKPGHNVTPQVDVETESEDSEDERELEEARYLSLQDVNPERRQRRAERSAQNARVRRRHEVTAQAIRHQPEERHHSQPPARSPAARRQVEHQSSLRSLLSASDIDDEDMREEIMRQISHEGLLDGLDWSNMTSSQEEEVIERITQALQRRQANAGRPSPSSGDRGNRSPRSSSDQRRPDSRPRSRSYQRHQERVHDRPPLSRPHLLAVSTENHRRQRNRSSSRSSQRSRQSTPNPETPLPTASRPSNRSTTDVSMVTSPDTQEHRIRAQRDNRSVVDSERNTLQPAARRGPATSQDRATPPIHTPPGNFQRGTQSPARAAEQPSRAAPLPPSTGADAIASAPSVRHSHHSSASDPTSSQTELHIPHSRPPRASTMTASALPPPIVACSRCHRPDIQSTLHYNCTKCDSGNFNICLQCFRSGKGCKHWFGFGYASSIRFYRTEPDSRTEFPHVLIARRYISGHADPETGLFCDSCLSLANTCYWHCGTCLDGAWGYCHACVSKGQHCTHPLDVVTATSSSPPSPVQATSKDRPHAHPTTKLLPHVPDPQSYRPLTDLPCDCDICLRPIPPSAARYHCPVCSEGDYDVCTACYTALAADGTIAPSDAAQGWRRCPAGHRMSVVAFEEPPAGTTTGTGRSSARRPDGAAPVGLRRVVLRERVGGWALKDDGPRPSGPGPFCTTEPGGGGPGWRWRETDGREAHVPFSSAHVGAANATASADAGANAVSGPPLLPPDGGVGLRVIALWSYWPAETVRDELAFPKHAEIREAEDINGDWFWGVYAGRKGLFPGNYGRVIR